MKQFNCLSLPMIVGLLLLGRVDIGHSEVYTQQNATPKLTSSTALDDISTQLYDLFNRSGADNEGIKALLDAKLWEKWTKNSTNFSDIKKKAITDKLLISLRDKTLEQINELAAIFLSVVKAKKGSTKSLQKARIAESQLQALVGPGLKSPCDIPGASSLCKDNLSFQEQWSLLKVFGLTFKHFLRTLEPLFAEDESQAFMKLKSAMDSQNTAMFIRNSVEFSEDDLQNNQIFKKYADAINKNTFLMVPVIAENTASAFSRYLDKVVDFVGTSDKQRAKDAKVIAQYWNETVDRLQKTFRILHGLQKKDVKGEKIKADKINVKTLPWGDKTLASKVSAIASDFSWLPAVRKNVSAIISRCESGEKGCYFEGCKQRYQLLSFVAVYLDTLLGSIERSLNDLKKMK